MRESCVKVTSGEPSESDINLRESCSFVYCLAVSALVREYLFEWLYCSQLRVTGRHYTRITIIILQSTHKPVTVNLISLLWIQWNRDPLKDSLTCMWTWAVQLFHFSAAERHVMWLIITEITAVGTLLFHWETTFFIHWHPAVVTSQISLTTQSFTSSDAQK